jgi:hypothetical protein
MVKKKLFISHISTETELAQSLKQRLEKDFLGLLGIFVSRRTAKRFKLEQSGLTRSTRL